jgi:hypothetical protein
VSVYVEQATADVAVEPEPTTGAAAGGAPMHPEDIAALQARMRRDAWRTHAEGYDD